MRVSRVSEGLTFFLWLFVRVIVSLTKSVPHEVWLPFLTFDKVETLCIKFFNYALNDKYYFLY